MNIYIYVYIYMCILKAVIKSVNRREVDEILEPGTCIDHCPSKYRI